MEAFEAFNLPLISTLKTLFPIFMLPPEIVEPLMLPPEIVPVQVIMLEKVPPFAFIIPVNVPLVAVTLPITFNPLVTSYVIPPFAKLILPFDTIFPLELTTKLSLFDPPIPIEPPRKEALLIIPVIFKFPLLST